MKSQRFTLSLTLAAALLATFTSSATLAVTLKIATLATDGSSWMQQMRAGAKQITEQTGGRVKFKFFPGGVMGDDKAVLRKMRIGQLHGAAMPSGGLAGHYPDSQIYNLPFKFRSLEEVDYVRARMDDRLNQGFAAKGFVTFGLMEGGFAYAMSRQAVSSPGDLGPLKVWIPDTDKMGRAAMKGFGITPIPLPLGDVLPSLQRSLIDTVASSPVGAVALQWYNHVDYMTDLPLLYFYAVFAIDKKAFKRIKPADQAVVTKVLTEVFKGIDKQNRQDNMAALETLKKRGVQVIQPNAEQQASWYQQGSKVLADLSDSGVVSAGLLQQLDQYLTEYRAANP